MDQASGALQVSRVGVVSPDGIVLAVTGELDIATVATFRAAAHAALRTTRHLVLELSGLGFCDSTGLGALVGLHNAATTAGVRLALVAPRRQVADVLALSGVGTVIDVYPSLSAAREATSPPPG